MSSSYHLEQWIIGRIITGIGNGINTSTVPTWQSESAKSHDRGKFVMIEGALITGGITTSYWINYGSLGRFLDVWMSLLTAETQDLLGSRTAKWHGDSPLRSRSYSPSSSSPQSATSLSHHDGW